MTSTAEVLLGIIAFAVLVMAIIQVGLIVVVVRLGSRLQQLGTQLEQDVRPLIAQAQEVVANAAHATSLAVAQVERADRLFADVVARVEDTSAILQNIALAPARQGRAIFAGIMAALDFLRQAAADRGSRSSASEDDDPLFIG